MSEEKRRLHTRQKEAEERFEEAFNLEKALWFELGDEHYVIKVESVQAVIDQCAVCHVPHTPAFIEGVINLRGNIIPLVNLKQMLGLPGGRGESAQIIILEVGSVRIGILADRVNEVADIDFSNLMPSPESVSGLAAEFIKGLYDIGRETLIVLDVGQIAEAGKRLTAEYDGN